MTALERFHIWLDDPAMDEDTRAELLSVEQDPKELEDRFYRDLEFGTAGMRGTIGAGTNRMNRYMVRKATCGLARFITELGQEAMNAGVAIAYDSRRFSDVFAADTASVLCAHGIHVYLYTVLHPVPMLSYAVRKLSCTAGVVITASHNPKQYNGYKVYGKSGGQLEPDDADVVTQKINAVESITSIPLVDLADAEKAGLLTWLGQEMDDAYQAEIANIPLRRDVFSKLDPDFRIVYTPLHGTGNIPVRRALHDAGVPGVVIVPEQELPDPEFSTVRKPNPEEQDALNMAIALAQKVGADLCIGTDPDCDRMGLAVRGKDGKFVLLSGNQTGCILLDYILRTRRELGTMPAHPAAVKSIVSTNLADAICADYGAEMFSVLTGFKFIAGKIEEFEATGSHSYLFGFEESFGYMAAPFVRDKDGVQACLLAAEAASWYRLQGMTLLDALEGIYKRFGYYAESVMNVEFPGKEGAETMAATMTTLRNTPPTEVGGLDVLSVSDHKLHITTFADGHTEPYAEDMPASNVLVFTLTGGNRFIIRPSGTEPKIKLYFNIIADTKEASFSLLEKVSADVKVRCFG